MEHFMEHGTNTLHVTFEFLFSIYLSQRQLNIICRFTDTYFTVFQDCTSLQATVIAVLIPSKVWTIHKDSYTAASLLNRYTYISWAFLLTHKPIFQLSEAILFPHDDTLCIVSTLFSCFLCGKQKNPNKASSSWFRNGTVWFLQWNWAIRGPGPLQIDHGNLLQVRIIVL